MSSIVVEGLAKRFGRPTRSDPSPASALVDVAFEVAEGEMLVLLGPSGCGKTTTLRCLAGLEEPDAGSVRFGDEVMFDAARRVDVAAHRRDVGLVFQSFALWPHLTVRGNIAYPLKMRRRSRTHRAAAVDEVAALVDLEPSLLDRRPGELSGGQQQRVALARALVPRPRVVLFDEPLSNLDAPLREQLRGELRLLHRRVGFTAVYVTHDLQEALALGDSVAVMDAGRVAQLGAAADVFGHPRTATLAHLLGFRPVARLGRTPEGWQVVGGGEVDGPLPAVDGAPPVLDLYARPEQIELVRPPGVDRALAGRVRVGGAVLQQAESVGHDVHVVLDRTGLLPGGAVTRLRLAVPPPDVGRWQVGAAVGLEVGSGDARFFTLTGERWGVDREAVPGPRQAHRLDGAS